MREAGPRLRVGIIATIPLIERGLMAMMAGDPSLDVGVFPAGPGLDGQFSIDIALAFLADDDELHATLESLDSSLPVLCLIEDETIALPDLSNRPLGLLSADADAQSVTASIRALHQGLLVLDPVFARRLRVTQNESARIGETPRDTVSPREIQVLERIADGLPNKAIAAELGISEHTVKFHVGSLLEKLGADSRAEAVMIATRRGILRI